MRLYFHAGASSQLVSNMLPDTAMLEVDSMKMEINFNTLVSQLCCSLETRGIAKESVVACLMGLSSLKKVFCGGNQCVFRAQRNNLDQCSTIPEVWRIIGDYFSFFDYDIIEQITSRLGTDEDKDNMKLYKTNFVRYARRRLVKGNISSGSGENLIVKLDSTYDECEVSRLKLFEWNLCSILHLNKGVLKLCKIDDGCVELTFSLPIQFITSDIFPLKADQEHALKSQGVIDLRCGNTHYKAEVIYTQIVLKGRNISVLIIIVCKLQF